MPTEPERELEQLLAEAPFVRDLAQQLIAGDPDEVVQRTWLQALQHGGGGVERPRHWLARIVRNIAANLRRDDRRRRARLDALPQPELVPSSSVLAEREERRRALVAAVDALPPTLRTVVLLRWFDGQPPRRIAAALGVPAATVSTQLQRALALLRQRLDAAHGGDRRAWLAPLVPFALPPDLPLPLPQPLPPTLPTATTAELSFAPSAASAAAIPATPALLLGVIVMTTKTKIAALSAALLLAASVCVLSLAWPSSSPPPSEPRSPVAGEVAGAELGELTAGVASVVVANAVPERQPAPAAPPISEPPAPTGELVVRVLHGDDRSPVPDTWLELYRPDVDPRFVARRQRTDAAGYARYERVAPGRWYVGNGLCPGKSIEVSAGATSEVELVLAVGVTVTGVVLDAARVPVVGALVEVAHRMTSSLPRVVAVTDANGRFEARACPDKCLVGARAFGYSASPVVFRHGQHGTTIEVELTLGASGGALDATIVDRTGRPIVGAAVIVGAGELSGIAAQVHIPPFPALAFSDANGRCRAIGVPAGAQPLRVRAPGFAPWTGTCTIAAGTTAKQQVELALGGAIRGTVHDAAGNAVAAEVLIGDGRDLAHYRDRSTADGAFAFDGLPVGEVVLRARHEALGKAELRVTTSADGPVPADLRLSRGLELTGSVVDADGQPIAGASIECMADPQSGQRWWSSADSDALGRFTVANCPESGHLHVVASAKAFDTLRQSNLDPRAPALQLRLQRSAPASVRFVARVVDGSGRAVANATASARRQDAWSYTGLQTTDADGRFELGPVVPGTWRVHVRSPAHPEFASEPRELTADATWDLGTITLPASGTARVRLLGEVLPAAQFRAVDLAHERFATIADATGGHRSTPLAPGDYRMLVSGIGVAAIAVPFTIRAGEEVQVDVALQAGVAQRIVVELPAAATGTGAVLSLDRAGLLVGRSWITAEPGARSADFWLAPGDYAVTATLGALRGVARFTVGAAPGPEVTIVLR